MIKKINYENNIFFLDLMLKQLSTGCKLNVDAETFLDKILGDIRFLAEVAGGIFASLKINSRLIERLEYLKNLEKFNKAFTRFLQDILDRSVPIANDLEIHFDELEAIQEKRNQNITEIKKIISGSLTTGAEADQIVSAEEFKFLLSQDEGEN